MDYANGKIYKLVSHTGKIYVGSTTQPLSTRLYYHYKNYECKKKGFKQSFCSSFELIEEGEVEIILVEVYPCENKDQLRQREQYWQEKIGGDCININRAYVSNIDKAKDAMTRYYKNQDAINENRREQYSSNNSIRDKAKANAKRYRTENKEQVKIYSEERVECECGSTIRRGGVSQHKKTKNHIAFTNSL